MDHIRAQLQRLHATTRRAADEARKNEEAFALLGLLYAELKGEVDARNELVAQLQKARADFGLTLPSYTEANVNAKQIDIAASVARWIAPKGVIDALGEAISAAESEWTAFADRPIGWAEFRNLVTSSRAALTVYHDRIADPKLDGHSLFEGYRQELREFARVDAHTARCIRQLVFTGALNGRNAFLRPMNEEVDKTDPDIADIVDNVRVTTKGVLRTRANTAIQILEFIFKHESGNQHVIQICGNEYVIMGIDWDNTGSRDKALFHEHNTNPGHWSQGRGWGRSQLTLADERIGPLKWECGIPYNVDPAAPRPNPDAIRSLSSNLVSAIRLFISNKFGDFSKRSRLHV